jgi:hypothetical protein
VITTARAKKMTDDELSFVRKDLGEVIQIQEKTERQFPGSCKKLGAYHDELYEVCSELKRRAGR